MKFIFQMSNFDSRCLNWFKLLATDSLLDRLFQAIAPIYLFYLFISRFVHIEYIQVLEQKDIASPTRFNHLSQPHKPRNSICIYN